MKPNIFRLATKELSQDGFFTWLLQWADNNHKQHAQRQNQQTYDQNCLFHFYLLFSAEFFRLFDLITTTGYNPNVKTL